MVSASGLLCPPRSSAPAGWPSPSLTPQRGRLVAQAVALAYTPDRGPVRLAWTPGAEASAFGRARRRHAPSVRLHPSGGVSSMTYAAGHAELHESPILHAAMEA